MLIFLGKNLILVKNADFSREKSDFGQGASPLKLKHGTPFQGPRPYTSRSAMGGGQKRSNLMLNSLLKIRNFRLSWTPRQRHVLNNSQKKNSKTRGLAIFKTADVETGKFLVKSTSLYIFYPLGNTLCKRLFIHIREFLAEPNTLCMFTFSVAVYLC